MTVYYLSIARFHDKQANVIQQIKMCDVLASIGEEVCLIHPSYSLGNHSFDWENFAEYYGIRHQFDVRTVRTLSDRDSKLWTYVEGTLKSVLLNLVIFCMFLTGRVSDEDVVYSRAFYPCVFLLVWSQVVPSSRRPTVVQELHTPVDSRVSRYLYANVDVLVCASEQVKETAIEEFGVDKGNCVVAPNAVDLDQYEMKPTEARETLGLPLDEEVVMYTGHLYERKGAHVLVDAASEIAGSVYIVGGYEEDVDRHRARAGETDIHFTGFVPPADVPVYQRAADVLVAPYTRDIRLGSPIKLFEYMAASCVIVASQLPMTETYLRHEQTAFFCPPEDPTALAHTINQALQDERGEDMAREAAEQVKAFTWKRRAATIMEFVRGTR